MKKKRTGAIPLFILNIISTCTFGIFTFFFAAIGSLITADGGTTKDTVSWILLLTVLIGIDILKWVAYYYLIVARKKSWFIMYIVYCLIFLIASILFFDSLFAFVILYMFALIHVYICIEQDEEGQSK